MSYCTDQHLIDRFGEQELIQLTDREHSGGIDYAVLQQGIADADAEINAYLTAYLPLSAIPANLTRIACDIVRYYLHDDQIVDIVENRYKSAIRYLEQVAAGKIALGPDITGATDAKTNDDVAYQTETPVFLGGGLNDF